MVSNFRLSENMAQPTIEPTSPNFGLIFLKVQVFFGIIGWNLNLFNLLTIISLSDNISYNLSNNRYSLHCYEREKTCNWFQDYSI
jgi:hypothetical protein